MKLLKTLAPGALLKKKAKALIKRLKNTKT